MIIIIMKKEIVSVMFIVLFIGLVSADIRVTLNTPQAAFRANYSDVINYYVSVENKNSFPVQVILSPKDLDIGFQSSSTFILQPNEKKEVNYSINVTQTGNYSRSILVTYKGNNETFTLQQTLFFFIPLRDGTLECDDIAYECSDGTSVYKDPENNCEFEECPVEIETLENIEEEQEQEEDTPIVYDNKEYQDDESTEVLFTTKVENETTIPSKPKSSTTLKILLVFIIFIIIALLGMIFWVKYKTQEQEKMVESQSTNERR
jgi:hypothetical protein